MKQEQKDMLTNDECSVLSIGGCSLVVNAGGRDGMDEDKLTTF